MTSESLCLFVFLSLFLFMGLYSGSAGVSCCQRRFHPAGDKVIQGEKHDGRSSEENRAACSSAISAWESPYKKHLLHFVLSMVL